MTTFATWSLVVVLLAPNYPQEHRQWDMTYHKIQTVQECEALASRQWDSFYTHYQSLPGVFWTRCEAHAHGKEWYSVVKCDRLGKCDVDRGEM